MMLAIVDSVWHYLYTFWPVWPTISLSFILLWSVVTLLYTPLHSLCLTFHACNFKLASSFSLPLAYQLSPWLHAFVHCLDKDRFYLVEILAQPFPLFFTVPLFPYCALRHTFRYIYLSIVSMSPLHHICDPHSVSYRTVGTGPILLLLFK